MTVDRYRCRMTEEDMRQTIKEFVEAHSGRVFHVRDSRRTDVEDVPDLLIVLPPVVALLELKSQPRPVTHGQAAVVTLLEQCSVVVSGIVRPMPRLGELSLDEALVLISGGDPWA